MRMPIILKQASLPSDIAQSLQDSAREIMSLKGKKRAILAKEIRLEMLSKGLLDLVGRVILRKHPAFDPAIVSTETERISPRAIGIGEGGWSGVYELGSRPIARRLFQGLTIIADPIKQNPSHGADFMRVPFDGDYKVADPNATLKRFGVT